MAATFAQVQWWLSSGTFVAYGDLVAYGYGVHFRGGLSNGANGRFENRIRGLKSATLLITKHNGPVICNVLQPQVYVGAIVAFTVFLFTFWPYFRR